nr:androgen-induced gene 1 protein isoform X1 [Saimiri boliviensis boliviensis]
MALVPCQVLRVAILLSYCSILCNYKAIEMPSHQTYGGSWKFLTFIDLVIQAVFFGICVLTDLSSLLTRGSGNQEQERQLKKLISLRDWMLAVLAFPVGVFVVAVFWIIYAYDREMIYPKLLDNFIPGWLNHGMHTTVLPFILIEMRTSHHQYPSRSSGLTAICTFSVGYILWVCWVHHVTGMWVYPFLEHIGPGARIIFFGSTTILMNFLYLLGEVLNNYIWDTHRTAKPKLGGKPFSLSRSMNNPFSTRTLEDSSVAAKSTHLQNNALEKTDLKKKSKLLLAPDGCSAGEGAQTEAGLPDVRAV